MTDKEKLDRIKKLADAMYTTAQYLSTDASRLRKAMDEYHRFIITEYNKQEPASEDLELFRTEYVDKEIERIYPNLSPHLPRKQKLRLNVFNGEDLEIAIDKATQWQKEQMMKDAIEGEVTGIGPLTNGNLIDSQKKTRRLSATYSFENTPYCELGNKVKVIIVKDND